MMSHDHPRERLGAIDVGSNSIRLLIAEFDPDNGLQVVDDIKDMPRLAHGLAETGALDPVAVERAMDALRTMRDVAMQWGVTRLMAIATAAVREASNGTEFIQRVRRELGIPLEIVSEDREARLSWQSVAHHFRLDGGRTMVADIGGGSLELIGAVDGIVETTASLPLGAVRLTEQALPGDDLVQQVANLRRHVRRLLRRSVAWRDWVQARVIGSGGTFTNLARMAVARRGPETTAVHGTTVRASEVESLLEWLCTLSAEERTQVEGLNPKRADIIIAGVAVVAELLALTDGREVTVSAFGLREGLLLEMAGVNPSSQSADPLRSIREFVDRCGSDRRHVEHVRYLALSLYDQVAAQLGGGPEERWILESAALLHDIGQLVSYRRHHHHSYQLIMHAERLGFDARTRLLVALVSRYHRKSRPRQKHAAFARLSEADQAVVRRLSGVLRIADGLDRGHTGAVESVSAELVDDQCNIHVVPRLPAADLALEIWGASRKSDVLARVLGCNVDVGLLVGSR